MILTMKQKILDAARQPNGCHYFTLPTFSNHFPKEIRFGTDVRETMGHRRIGGKLKSTRPAKISVATELRFWVAVHAKSHPYGATFVIGYIRNAVFTNESSITKKHLTFCAQNAQ